MLQQPIAVLYQIIITAGVAIALTAFISIIRHNLSRCKTRTGQAIDEKTDSVWHAPILDRAGALLLDLAVLSAVYLLIFFNALISGNWQVPYLALFDLEAFWIKTLFVGTTGFGGAWFLYRIVTEACFSYTFGKLILGLRVVDADNSHSGLTTARIRKLKKADEPAVGWKAATLRNLILVVDGCGWYSLGAIRIYNSPKNQRFGDALANTIVIRRGIVSIPHPPSSPSRSLGSPYEGAWRVGGFGGGFSGGSSSEGGDFGGGGSGGGGAGGDF